MGNSDTETKLSGLYPLTPGFVKPKKHRIPLLASRYSIIGIGCLSFSYYLTVLSIPEKRLVMDYIHDEYSNNGSGKPRYNGGMIDTFKKIYLEEGFLGMMGKKDALSFLIEAGTGLVYSQTIGKIFQPFNSNDNLMVSLGSSFIDNLLLGVFIHPIIVISHANHKRFDDEKKEKGIFEIGKKIYEENGIRGLYRGFGLFTLQNESPFTTVPKSGLQWAIRSGIEFILGTKHESLDSDTIDSLDMLEGAICDMILDAVSYPFLLSYGRYIGDQGSTYVSYVDCFQKMYQQEGWKGLYKGSWIGFLLK